MRLDRPTQRPRAIRLVVAFRDKELAHVIADLQRDVLFLQPAAHLRQQQVHDLPQLGPRQRVEDHHLINPVEELRPEHPAQPLQRPGAQRGVLGVPLGLLALGVLTARGNEA
ncbi:MAG TPA: hypothetical protein VET66_08500, partial [Steroidobacteraceae bacterium]|nr:hypothetical protein [Steroidobacteraceae bacterium]